MRKIVFVLLAASLAGCASTRMVATTYDGRVLDAVKTAQIVDICQSRGEIAAQGIIPSAPAFALSSEARLGDAIGRGIADGVRRAEARNAVRTNCYAENGVKVEAVPDQVASQ